MPVTSALPRYRPVTGLCGFPITWPMHSFIRACKLCKRQTEKVVMFYVQESQQSYGKASSNKMTLVKCVICQVSTPTFYQLH